MRVPDTAPVWGAADWRLGLGAVDCGLGASCGITPGGGGEGVAAGGCPPVGGPVCAIASDVPPRSSATIARVFMLVIYTSGCLRRTHPDEHGKRAYEIVRSGRAKKEGRVTGPSSSFGVDCVAPDYAVRLGRQAIRGPLARPAESPQTGPPL